MKISLILPIYNLDLFYIKRCINSILTQKYNNWECILVDDGSDNKYIHYNYYSELSKDKRFKYFYKNNGGLGNARNFGFTKSSGNLIWFIDPDDYIRKEISLELIVNIFKENNEVDLLNFNYFEILESGIKKNINPKREGTYKNEINQIYLDEFNSWRTVWRNVYKREYLENFHIMHQDKKVLFEDVYFDLIVKSTFNKIYFSESFIYYYDRTRSGSIVNKTKNKKKQYIQMRDNILEAMEKLKKNNQFSEIFYFHCLNYFVTFPFFKKEFVKKIKNLNFKNLFLSKKIKFILFFSCNSLFKIVYKLFFNKIFFIYKKIHKV